MSPAGPLLRQRPPWDAVTWLTLYLVLLFAIPSRLVIGALGSAGAPSMLIGLVSLLSWVLYQIIRAHPLRGGVEPVHVALGVFVLAVSASYVAAMARPIEGNEVSPADVALLAVASWSGTLLLAHDGVTTKERLEVLVRRVAVAGGALALLGLAQFATGQAFVDRIAIPGLTASDVAGSFTRQGFTRPVATATHPIEFGVLLTMLLPFALHAAFHGTGRSWFSRWFPVLAIGAVLPVSFSRSAYLGSALCLIVLLVGWPRARRRALGAGLAALLTVMFVAVPGLFGSIAGLFTGVADDPSIGSRTESYTLAAQFIGQSPVVGRGLGTFLPKYRIFDNQYLLLLVTVGILGTLAFLAIVVTAIVMLVRLRRRTAEPDVRDLALCVVASLVAGSASLALFDAFAFPMTMGTLFLVLGIAGAVRRVGRVGAGGSAATIVDPPDTGEFGQSPQVSPGRGRTRPDGSHIVRTPAT